MMTSVRWTLARWVHRVAYWIVPEETHELVLRDARGVEVFDVMLTGSFAASHPGPDTGLTLWCRHDDELVEL